MEDSEEEYKFILIFPNHTKAKQKVNGKRADALMLADQLANELVTRIDVYRVGAGKRIYIETCYPDNFWRMC